MSWIYVAVAVAEAALIVLDKISKKGK